MSSKSYLSMIASQEIAAHLWQVWDVDHSSGDLLIEAEPRWDDGYLAGLTWYPQIILDPAGTTLRGDKQQMESVGEGEFDRILLGAAQAAVKKHLKGETALFFEQMRPDIQEAGYRLPPRLFSRAPIREVGEHTFIVRYISKEDRDYALRTLPTVKLAAFTTRKEVQTSRTPPIAFYFDLGMTCRALKKIGFNLLAACCKKTPIDRKTFPDEVRLILGERHPPDLVVAGNGFVHAADLEDLQGPPNRHVFRLVYFDDRWFVYSSFFGGRIGSFVELVGPNGEDWNSMTVTAPIGSKEWTYKESVLIQPIKVRVEWHDSRLSCPSLKLQSSKSQIQVEMVKPKGKQ